MKKLLCMILSLSLLLGGISFVFAEEEVQEYIPSVEYSNALELLQALGAYTGENVPAPGEKVLRKDFVKQLYKLAVGGSFPDDWKGESKFSDVLDAIYIPYINAMSDAGIVSGFSDGTFGADRVVTGYEAITLIIRALGYDVIADSLGGYPFGYIEQAKRLGIIKNEAINNATLLTNEATVIFFKRALTVPLMGRVVYGSSDKLVIEKTNETLLSGLYRTGIEEGIVEGTDATKLYGDNDVPPWNIRINGKDFDIGKLNPEALLGFNVEAYYALDTDILVAIFEKENKNNVKVIDIADITAIEGNSVVTEIEGKKIKYSYPVSAAVIFNMAATRTPFNTDIFKDKNGAVMDGTVTLIDNGGESGFDVIKISAGRSIVVSDIDYLEYKVEDMNSEEITTLVPEIDEPYIEFYDSEGVMSDFASIKKGNTLTVYETLPDAPQTMIRVNISSQTLSGVVEGTFEDNGMYVTLKGETYKVSSGSYGYIAGQLEAGSTYTFYMTKEGYIAAFKKGSASGANWGMVINVRYKETLDDSSALIRIMTQDGKKTVYELAKRVKIDGVIISDNQSKVIERLKEASKTDMQNRANNTEFCQMLLFKTDSEGKIDYFDTVMHEPGVPGSIDNIDGDNCLWHKFASSSTAHNSGGTNPYSQFEEKFILTNSVKLFAHPVFTDTKERFNNPDNYWVGSRNNIVDKHQYTITAYFTDSESVVSKVGALSVSGGASSISQTTRLAVIDKVTRAVNNDGVQVYKLSFWRAGNYESRFMDTTVTTTFDGKRISGADLIRGDVIRYGVNDEDIIDMFHMHYRAKTDTQGAVLNYNSKKDEHTYYNNPKLIMKAYAVRKYDDGFDFVYEIPSAPGTWSEEFMAYAQYSPKVYYNRTNNRVEEGDLSNIRTAYFDESGNLVTDGATRLLIHTHQATIYSITIIGE